MEYKINKINKALIYLWTVYLIQHFVFKLLSNFSINPDILFLLLLIICFPINLLILIKSNKKLALVFIISYFSRVLLMIIDIYYPNFIRIPHSGIDSERFFIFAEYLSNNLSLITKPIYGSYFTKILAIIFKVTVPIKLVGNYFNLILGMSSILIMNKILIRIGLKSKNIKKGMFIYSFFPHSIILSSILLREQIIIFLGISSLDYFIRWIQYNRFLFAFKAVLLALVASVFHSGIIVFVMIYFFYINFYEPETNAWNLNIKNAVKLFSLLLVLTPFYLYFSEQIFIKFKNIESINDLYQQSNVRGGGSAYLTNLKTDNFLKLILFSPLKMLYFLGSPMPMNWRSFADIFSFFVDSIFYLYFILYLIKNFKIVKNNNISFFLLLLMITSVFMFATGVANAGTAMRHRQKIFYLFVIIFVFVDEKKNNYIV